METKEILAELKRDYKEPEIKEESNKPQADKFNAVCIIIQYLTDNKHLVSLIYNNVCSCRLIIRLVP